MDQRKFRYRSTNRPRAFSSGEPAFYVAKKLVDSRHEIAATIAFITGRERFGQAYRGLQPDYFHRMSRKSGVYCRPLVPTKRLAPDASFPGDVDLLIVPYDGDELVLHRTIALEIKVVRATFRKQGKSPNEFGFSQAAALMKLGFPYVAVAHLIVSDKSPRSAWRPMGVARVLDRHGRVELLNPVEADWLPIDLMLRSIGRLNAAAPPSIGLVACYVGSSIDDLTGSPRSGWLCPDCRAATWNPLQSRALLRRVAELFESDSSSFFDNPRYDAAKRGSD